MSRPLNFFIAALCVLSFANANLFAQSALTSAELSLHGNAIFPTGDFKTSGAFAYVLNVAAPGGGGGAELNLCLHQRWLVGAGANVHILSFDHERQAQILQARYAQPSTSFRRFGPDPIITPGNHSLTLHAGHRLAAGRWMFDALVGVGIAGLPSLDEVTVWRKTIGSNAIDTIKVAVGNRNGPTSLYFQQLGSLRVSYAASKHVLFRIGATYATGSRGFQVTERISPLFGDATETDFTFRNRISTVGLLGGIVLHLSDFGEEENK